MGLVWNWYAIPGFLAMFTAILMASFVYFAAPGGQQANRRLALVLLLQAAATGAGNALIYVVDQANLARAAQAVSVTAVLLLPTVYLLFLATVDSPLVRPLRHRAGETFAILVGAVSVLLYFSRPEQFISGVSGPYWYAQYDADLGPWYRLQSYLRLLVLVFAFVVALDAFRRATTALGRQRAKAYAIAFGVWDAVTILITFFINVILPLLANSPNVVSLNTPIDLIGVAVYPFTILIFAPLLALGILRTQLFDIKVKIKFTINKGTLASFYVAVFFIVSKVIENFFGSTLNWFGGAIAAGLLLFAINPLGKAAERLAEKAVPDAKPVAELSAAQRLELFKEQLEFAFADGSINKKERMLIEHLRARLGVDKDAARKLESRVMTTMGIARPKATPA